MFITLNHQDLDVCKVVRSLVNESYRITTSFPGYERFGLSTQIRRAAVSVYLNLAEGFSRRSFTERKRFFEIARGSIIEIDAALDIASDLRFLQDQDMSTMNQFVVRSFQLVSAMMNAGGKRAK